MLRVMALLQQLLLQSLLLHLLRLMAVLFWARGAVKRSCSVGQAIKRLL